MSQNLDPQQWLGLMIGNSRLHWAYFSEKKLRETWDSEHLSEPILIKKLFLDLIPNSLRKEIISSLPIYIASVVPQQNHFWQGYPQTRWITLEDIPLKKLYPTMGSDRALALWGAGNVYGFPCLVIDGGTALTITAVNEQRAIIGGAILPGLRLQLKALATQTAALPEVNLTSQLPSRWGMTTPDAIASGIIYTMIAGIKSFLEDWWLKFPQSPVILTGGDSYLLQEYLGLVFPEIKNHLKLDSQVIFWGLRSLKYPEN